eukprot:gene5395-2760_t
MAGRGTKVEYKLAGGPAALEEMKRQLAAQQDGVAFYSL